MLHFYGSFFPPAKHIIRASTFQLQMSEEQLKSITGGQHKSIQGQMQQNEAKEMEDGHGHTRRISTTLQSQHAS